MGYYIRDMNGKRITERQYIMEIGHNIRYVKGAW